VDRTGSPAADRSRRPEGDEQRRARRRGPESRDRGVTEGRDRDDGGRQRARQRQGSQKEPEGPREKSDVESGDGEHVSGARSAEVVGDRLGDVVLAPDEKAGQHRVAEGREAGVQCAADAEQGGGWRPGGRPAEDEEGAMRPDREEVTRPADGEGSPCVGLAGIGRGPWPEEKAGGGDPVSGTGEGRALGEQDAESPRDRSSADLPDPEIELRPPPHRSVGPGDGDSGHRHEVSALRERPDERRDGSLRRDEKAAREQGEGARPGRSQARQNETGKQQPGRGERAAEEDSGGERQG